MPEVVKQGKNGQPGRKASGAGPSILSRIKQVGFNEDDGLKVLLYGRSGTGKTTTWATFPKPILALVCSGGKKPGELRSIDTPEYRKTVFTAVVQNSSEIAEICNSPEIVDTYKTIVLDHATGLQDKILSEITGKEIPEQKKWGLASQQEYQQCTAQTKELLKQLLSLNCNVVVVAQERVFNQEESGLANTLIMPTIGAGLTPSLTGWLNTAVDYIVYSFIRAKMVVTKTTVGEGKNAQVVETVARGKGVQYCLRVGADDIITTKFRMPKRTDGSEMPDVIVDPSYDKIVKLIRGSGGMATKVVKP